MSYLPCNNPQCPSYGHPHPNCRCHGDEMAHGGSVESFCSKERGHSEGCHYFAEGGSVMHPEHALGHAAIHHGLSGLLKKVGQSEKVSPEDHTRDYMRAAARGQSHLHKHAKSMLGSEKTDPPEVKPHKALADHLEHIRENPHVLLDVGVALGEHMPAHTALLSARAAQAVNYFDSIRPMPSQAAPLDKVTPASPMAKQKYARQLDIAEAPLLILKHIRSGTLQQQDLTTVQTLYPALYQQMVSKMSEKLIEKKSVPYAQRRSLGMLLGQPLDSTMTPEASQAIMKANAGSSKEQTQPQGGGPKKASAAELKETDKWTKIVGTKSQDKELGK